MLDIYAGKSALKTIKEKGFSADLFTNFLGASGGPKWFVLYGLDKYLFGDFFKERQQVLNLIGSSAGAFRAACFAQNDPVAAIERLAKHYSETVYSKNANAHEVTNKARELMVALMRDTGVQEIMNNPVFKAHFVVARCNGFVSTENKLLQGLGLAKSIVANFYQRSCLRAQYQRVIFQPDSSELAIKDPDDFQTDHVAFTQRNLVDALLASGSIPMVMEGIKNIADVPGYSYGMYRDGGIIDYHFDIAIDVNNSKSGLTLYPHFSANLKAGWFDKNLKRKVHSEHYDNTVLICPSEEFIQSLPYNKIPDRKDFTELEPNERIAYWRTVFTESEKLAKCFEQFVKQQRIDLIKPISSLVA